MIDLTTLAPYVIGFFVVAAVATGLAITALASLAVERRRPVQPLGPVAVAHPTASTTRRAA